MNYSKWCSRWGLSTRVSIDPTRSWHGSLSNNRHVRRTCKICSSTMWQWCGDWPPQDMPRSDFNSLALGTRQASGLGRARQKYVFVPYRELAYVTEDLFLCLQANRGCIRSRLLHNMCSSKEDGTYYNQFSRYFTTLYGMIHHKRGGTLRRGYRLKEQEMTM